MKVLLGLAALALTVFFAASATGGNTNKDIVNGGFKDIYGFNNGFHGESGPSGENPTGHENALVPASSGGVAKISEDVVCLAVSGNLAAVGSVGTFTAGGNTSPSAEVLIFRDGGPAGSGDGFDAYNADPSNCQAFLVLAASAPAILGGNISINDAP